MQAILDRLEQLYGAQTAPWPSDAYRFLVWWNCGYPASDAACAKGWEALQKNVGIEPDQILATPAAKLSQILKAGGLVPDVRAERLQQLADRTLEEFDGDLTRELASLSLAKARALLKSFDGIADPGADRILLFAGIAPVAAAPSNSPQVVVRIHVGEARGNYNQSYKQALEIIEASVPATVADRSRAYLLLKRHGEQLCKRSAPRCHNCPVAAGCKFHSFR